MSSLDLTNVYQVGVNEKVREMEAELDHELAELTTELEEVDLPPRTTSSVPLPQKTEHFKQERKFSIKRALEVSGAQPVCIQAETMKAEMEITEQNEYTLSSLPLLLLQHFTERIQHLIHLRHQYMLRWRRFCEHSGVMEALYPAYNDRLSHIVDEYKDCVQRAQRLSVAREALMLDKPESAATIINMEDLLIYLRWMVCHLHSMKRFNQFLKVLQWLPTTNRADVAPPDVNVEDQEETSRAAPMAPHCREDLSARNLPDQTRSASPGSDNRAASSIPYAPKTTIQLMSSLPSSAHLYAATASGGGLASDERLLGLPVHTMDLQSLMPKLAFLINVYAVNFDLASVYNSSDEMEMFGVVNRRFKEVFSKQEHLNQLKTYDRFEAGQEPAGTENSSQTFRKEANWSDFVSLHAERDPQQETAWAALQQRKYFDEILNVQAHFVKVTNCKKVQDTLKIHAAQAQDPQPVMAASVTSHRTPHNTSVTWKKIYSNPDLYTDTDQDQTATVPDIDEREVETVNSGANSGGDGRAQKRKDSYDYVSTVQMLGLDDGDKDKADVVTTQGAYLSYLYLRHLRIRDMQRTCLSVLNYFRSIERTLTINDQGLIGDEHCLHHGSFQNHRVGTDADGGAGGGGGLGFHGYLHNTPADFKMSESEFIHFSEVKNHDDFYVVEEGRVQVLDQKGHRIIYDLALADLRLLEADLMLMSSHYIEKDRDLRSVGKNRPNGSARSPLDQLMVFQIMDLVRSGQGYCLDKSQAGDFDIASYAHQDVDRFGILLDTWTNEAAFLECKRELMDCYYEAYQHVVDRDERRKLAQVITNIIHQRPRFDPHSDYFVRTYRAECSVLRKHAALVKAVLDRQIESDREYVQRVTRDGDREIGLPHRIIPKQPIAVNLSRPALNNVFMLEFHPALSIASRIPAALKHAYLELYEIHRPTTLLMALMMEKQLLQVALNKWDALPMLGTGFSTQVQKDLFSDTFAEDPLLQCQLALSSVKQQEEGVAGRRTHKERQLAVVQTLGRLMDILTLRHRMMEACWETEILSMVYREQALEMGFPEYHLYLRFVQFEFATFKEQAGKTPPIFITTVQEDDGAVDKFTPSCLCLAVHELDEGHVGRFSFRSRDSMLQLMRAGGVENFQAVLKAQVVHKNALMVAVQLVSLSSPVKVTERRSGRLSHIEAESERSSQTQLTSTSGTTSGNAPAERTTSGRTKMKPQAFFSLQLEKSPSRDLMLNDFVTKKQMGSVLKNSEVLEQVKRKLISEFCERFYVRLSQASMRGQLLAFYSSMLNLLSRFPRVRETYFVLGEPNEKKTDGDGVEGLTCDPRKLKKRPRRLLSSDGRHVLNIWFLPDPTELLVMFKTLDDSLCGQALTYSLSIVGALHDILQYLSVLASLSSSHTKTGSISTNLGSTEAIGSELWEIQKQIQNLPDPTYPQSVLELLNLRRDVMFLEYDIAVRHCMTSTFLSSGNVLAYKSLTSNAQYAMTSISSIQRASLLSAHLTVPEPLEARDVTARSLFPWRTFINSFGPYPVAFGQWFRIEGFMNLCLAGLKSIDRNVAGGEILGVSLLMEDVLQTGSPGAILSHDLPSRGHSQTVSRAEAVEPGAGARNQNVVSDLKEASSALAGAGQQSLSRVKQPLEAYRLLLFFLQLWKVLEKLQLDWGKKKLSVEKIDSSLLYREFCKLYRTEILLPALQSVARRLGQGDLYDDLVLDTDVYAMPHGGSETELKLKQLLRLLESLECHMIMEVRKRVSRELTLAVAERAREEEVLPTDLWKRAVMKETLTLNRPHIAERFVNQLMSEVKDTDTTVTFDCQHLQSCLTELARNVVLREKQNFDSYSMYYDNMLRLHHQLLFQREQEIKHLTDQLKQAQSDMTVSVQCQLADQAHDLLMEVTALRAKVVEMRELSMTQERDIRERVKEEYEDLIHNIFNSTFLLHSKFDEFRNDLQDSVMDKVTETRRDAVEALSKLQLRFTGTLDKDKLDSALDGTEQIRTLLHENHLLNKAILKLKAVSSWRQNIKTQNFIKTAVDLQKKAEGSKKDHLESQMLAEEEVVLLRQQLLALRKALTATEKDCSQVRQMLQDEMKIKTEKRHDEAERKRNKHQLDEVRQVSVDKLIEELVDKELRLKKLEADHDRSTKQTLLEQERAKRDLETFKKQSSRERNLKLGAFHRVDVLQSQVYDLESCLVNRPPSVLGQSSKQRSRATSAQTSRLSRPSTGLSQWSSAARWSVRQSLTPFGELPSDASVLLGNEVKTIARPRTVGGRVRGRIAEVLLSEMAPESKGRLLLS